MKKLNLKQWLFLFLSITIFLSSCDDDDDDITISGIFSDGAFITNEGAYGAGNGSVSFYSYSGDTITNEIFKTVNNRSLGDVVQSLTKFDNKIYIVVNVSNKVEVVNSEDFTEYGVITDLNSPRYFMGINNEKGYVTQWGEEGIVNVIDLTTLSITKTITVGAGAEQMILHNDLVYVSNSGGYANNNTISIIDTKTDEVTKTITLDGDSPRDFVLDANNDIWVLCAGYTDYSDMSQTPSKLIRIDPTTNEVAESIIIAETIHPTCLEISKNGNNLFYGGGYGVQGIFKMSIDDDSAPTTPLLNKNFYGFNINPETGNIFAMEAPSFTANGTLWRYKTDGTELGSYEAGIGPNSAGFKKK
ncbi:MAG: hypothetical protein GQ564_17345 [Bacteroidales bacterium]|nr:hypothetical protein [Bacteroidales bacterium]